MNEQEITAYLAAPHIAVVATIHRNGHPHLTPNWYRYDGKALTLITRKDRLKYLNLQRNNRISRNGDLKRPRHLGRGSPHHRALQGARGSG
jgi:nitroimidazol reductase NimA-like FMN-containing flavoprotein (pyridoxamine 5'-phosphate oxidase superfamily)